MGANYDALKAHLQDIANLNRIGGLLGWDHQVMMPPGGATARASQMATLSRVTHELFTSDKTARLLDAAAGEVAALPYESDEASMLRVVRQDYDEAVKLPADLVGALAEATGLAHEVWAHARQTNDFPSFRASLERILDLTRQVADKRGYNDHPYDALINDYERGLTTQQVAQIFDAHRPELVQLIADINANRDRVSDAPLRQAFDVDKQREFAVMVVTAYGYDFERGRLDQAVHPFESSFSRGDVRITTRYNPNWLNPALFGTMHEAGHAMYEQGIGESLEGTPLGHGTSLGIHESQSRMWENVVGRSKGFWSWALPKLQATFPDQLGNVDLDTFWRAINNVSPSFIRVEADEATYNLHIMLRFELETELLTGNLNARDLPDEWNQRFEAYFGLTPDTDTVGVLQDIHWSSGLIGYFPTYALGNLLSVQFYNRAVAERPSIPDDIARGNFDTLRTWLNESIHQYGRKFTSDELTRRVTGESIQSRDYMTYLKAKFGEVYGL